MELTDFGLEIIRAGNGYTLRFPNDMGDGFCLDVIEDDESDELKSDEELLWHVMEYFGIGGSKHDPERLRIVRENDQSLP